MSLSKIRVVVADSNRLIRIGLGVVLSEETDIEMAGEAESEVSLKELLNEVEVDVLLIDFTAPQFSIETVPAILSDHPNIQVVAITPDQEGHTIVNALKAGVKSYVKKDCDLNEIVSSVRDTASGNKFFCGQILNTIHQVDIDPESEDFESFNCEPVKLSEREQEIITLIAEGHTNTTIAEKLFLSPHTVNTHRKNIMHKLGVKNTASIVMYAVKSNLVNVNKFLFSK
ncbi:MAG: response regulator transcription factor [Cryomorphaceae bacterium]